MVEEPGGRHQMPSGQTPTQAGSRLLQRNRRLHVFPAIAFVGGVAMFPVALEVAKLAAVAVIALLSFLWPDVGTGVVLVVAAYPSIAVFIAGMMGVVVFCNFGLMAATEQVRSGEQPSVVSGLAVGLRRLPNVVVMAAVAGLSLMLVGVFERRTNRERRERFAATFGTSFTASTYLAGPAAVLDGASSVGMFRRSSATLTERFGPAPTVTVGPMKKYVLAGVVPMIVVQLGFIVWMLLTGDTSPDWLTHPAVLVGAVAPLWIGIVYGGAVGAVIKTLVYISLEKGWDRLPMVNVHVEKVVDVLDEPEESDGACQTWTTDAEEG